MQEGSTLHHRNHDVQPGVATGYPMPPTIATQVPNGIPATASPPGNAIGRRAHKPRTTRFNPTFWYGAAVIFVIYAIGLSVIRTSVLKNNDTIFYGLLGLGAISLIFTGWNSFKEHGASAVGMWSRDVYGDKHTRWERD
jgi:hypothetical protein